jgi:ATP-dependent protease ClpP protease subunit
VQDEEVISQFGLLLAADPSTVDNDQSTQATLFLHQPRRLIYGQSTDMADLHEETTRLDQLRTNIDRHLEQQRSLLDSLARRFEGVMIV